MEPVNPVAVALFFAVVIAALAFWIWDENQIYCKRVKFERDFERRWGIRPK